MIIFSDFETDVQYQDIDFIVWIGDGATPSGMIEPSEEITSMLDRGAKVQYWLMEHGYPTEYRVLTTNPQSYSLLVPDFKVIKIEPVPEPEPFIEIKKEGVD